MLNFEWLCFRELSNVRKIPEKLIFFLALLSLFNWLEINPLQYFNNTQVFIHSTLTGLL